MDIQDYHATHARMAEYKDRARSLAYLWSDISRPGYGGEHFKGELNAKTIHLVRSRTDDYSMETYEVDCLTVPVELLFLPSPEEQSARLMECLHESALDEYKRIQQAREWQRRDQIERLRHQQKAATDKLRELEEEQKSTTDKLEELAGE